MMNDSPYSVILMDDECLICNRLVGIVAKKDRRDKFRICGLKSEKGKKLLKAFGLESSTPDSLILIQGDKVFLYSDAVLKIAEDLNTYKWPLKILLLFPRYLRNRIYFFIAKNRYSFFGKSKYCSIDPMISGKIIY
ncbi:MAG TPA: DCC1-like thiol-disulfide oxidoreductase family protein [Bacteroidia bacterium]|nr:DCC1-like thiol-disulfide oxidoreductase family protein [Bacteroidia bacterium]HNS12042.1 DCC1-like thiol-disulfide oxidoreductase family protein [Bacteroidia bacterium]